MKKHKFDTIIIGAGQAGLVTGYYLQQQNRDFIILDGAQRIGDTWRNRWDSLRLFTPARFDGLAGLPFPAPKHHFPSKDEMGDYLEQYAAHFDLPVELGVRIDKLSKEGPIFQLYAGDRSFEAENVVVAMSNYQVPRIPSFAEDLDPDIFQIHSAYYRNPGQLQDGNVLIVGAGNSGAEIGLEVAQQRPTWMSGRKVPQVPFRIENFFGKHIGVPLVMRFIFHRLLNVGNPIGRKARPNLLHSTGPLVRVKNEDLEQAGIQRVPRMVGVSDAQPLFEDGSTLDVDNIIWCTGYNADYSWIDLPVFEENDGYIDPVHDCGVVKDMPGLYFVGLFFLRALSSSVITGISRDARYIASQIARRPVATPSKVGSIS